MQQLLGDDVPLTSQPHGFGHADGAATLCVAGSVPGPNANAVTHEHLLEPITGTAVLNGVPVIVTAARVTDVTAAE